MASAKAVSEQQIKDETRRFFQKVYAWMFAGLILSGLAAFLVAVFKNTSDVLYPLLVNNKTVFWILIGTEVALIFSIFALMKKMSPAVAIVMFFVFSIVSGITLSVIFKIFTFNSIAITFMISSLMFGSMSLYGFFTKSDMTFMGHALAMGLWGIILALFVNMFFQNKIADYIISVVGVIIFSGMTAYDTQRIKKNNIIGNEGTQDDWKESIFGALELYLDFVNMFLSLLRLTGKNK